MTQQDNKVLACVDRSPYAEHVADAAYRWLKRNSCSIGHAIT
jgi:hypothetical protein